MGKKLSPIYRKNNGPDPRYDEMLAEIAKHLPPDAGDPEQTADEIARKDREMDLGDYEKSYGEH